MSAMRTFRQHVVTAGLVTAAALLGCKRDAETAPPPRSGESGSAVRDDLKNVGKATQKAAKDIGQATVELADKAGDRLEHATNKAAEGGQDAWITTKVKSALTSEGLDALHLHVDTEAKVVTLSGSVESTAQKAKAVSLARGVTGVVEVRDHLFVKPAEPARSR